MISPTTSISGSQTSNTWTAVSPKKYSAAPDYFEKASAAIKEMIRLTGGLIWNQKEPVYAGPRRRHPPYGPSGRKGRFDPAPALDQREPPEAPVPHQYHEPVHAVLQERGLSRRSTAGSPHTSTTRSLIPRSILGLTEGFHAGKKQRQRRIYAAV